MAAAEAAAAAMAAVTTKTINLFDIRFLNPFHLNGKDFFLCRFGGIICWYLSLRRRELTWINSDFLAIEFAVNQLFPGISIPD
jgi:hypothetical protein